ncbi:hypothetical protein EVAR_48591_1 [Eumeta japonica]|uniref:Uncharacterized protein n=1 Tax=Eumeta variegata TaxID=151549 RepID=A0A4C1Z0W2_EUMVA|nr:hypothetical protein EVAR_48591_1 [Eumeta japonica]
MLLAREIDVENHLNDMRATNMIGPSCNPWCSPMVMTGQLPEPCDIGGGTDPVKLKSVNVWLTQKDPTFEWEGGGHIRGLVKIGSNSKTIVREEENCKDLA